MKTGVVSDSGEGRHTTVRRQLIALEQGAMFIDTPGMREIGVFGAGEGIEGIFDDILEIARTCRFANCSHTNEPGCAVLQAIKNNILQLEHYSNYVKLKQEAEVNDTGYPEKRKKNKPAGKDDHTGTKHKKKII